MIKISNDYNLEERTAKFGEEVIGLCKSINHNTVTRPIVSQLIRSGTSIGANYMEANASSSRKDFRNKIFICKKETQETKHWLRMLLKCLPEKNPEIKEINQETQELTLIFGKIVSTLDNRKNSKLSN